MIIACPDCGTIQRLPPLQPGRRLLCRRCDKVLERTAGRSLDAALALALATLVVWFPANLTTLLSIRVLGAEHVSRLGSGIIGLWNQGWPELAVVVGLQGVVLPFLRFGLLSAVLTSIRFGVQGGWTGPAFRWAQRLDPWAMSDVFLVGAMVGYSRIRNLVPVTIGPGGWCLIVAALLTMLTRASLDTRSVWRMILPLGTPPAGPRIACTECDMVLPARMEHCLRCAARLWARKPHSVMRTTALIAAGYPLYLIANYFPMNIESQFGNIENQTIFYGIERLLSAGFWPLAVIIFVASVVIPLAKMIGLSWLLWSVRRQSDRRLKRKTRIYRFIEEIGRWSNIDVFTITIFLPIMQLDGLVRMRAGTGAPAFLAVIVLTMIAARIFDPRLMWDNARERI
jgi:paraquat-inducible protein A